MEQSKYNSKFKLEPIAVIKMNKVEPLVIVDAKVFFKMMRENG